MIDIDLEEPFCFYLVALEGVQLKEPIWFEYTEVELVAPPHVDAQTGESERSLRENQNGSMEWQNAAKSARYGIPGKSRSGCSPGDIFLPPVPSFPVRTPEL